MPARCHGTGCSSRRISICPVTAPSTDGTLQRVCVSQPNMGQWGPKTIPQKRVSRMLGRGPPNHGGHRDHQDHDAPPPSWRWCIS
eukprot:scaffold1243_cov403-Prasinococcus_capsulatus_cf.AAC.20